MAKLWREYNLSIVLATLFLVSWMLQTWLGWMAFAAEQQAHGQAAQVFGPDGYIWVWGEATFENWQSEFLQLLTFVVLTTYLVHRGSNESKDSSEKMQESLDRIEKRLREIETGRAQLLRAGLGSGAADALGVHVAPAEASGRSPR
jgi:uncharacterized protein DUF6766